MRTIETLRKLEITDKYLFHGTATNNIELFEPRQAMSHSEKDGVPCVAASKYIEPAIFMAIFSNRVPCGWDSHDAEFGLYLKRSDYDKVKAEDWSGFVYVFERKKFSLYRAWEWRAYTKVKPLKKLRVSFADLPVEIELT